MSRRTAASALVLLLALTACADEQPTPTPAAPAPACPTAAAPSPSGADYAFTADEPTAMTAQVAPAVKTAFTGGKPGAAPTERVVRWVGLRDDRMVSLVLHATEDGACAPGLGGDLSTTDLADLEPLIDELVETSPLPVAAA